MSLTNVYPSDRAVFITVTIDTAVFEDVLCPQYHALQYHHRTGEETKTSL
jgi:hypothetical protein